MRLNQKRIAKIFGAWRRQSLFGLVAVLLVVGLLVGPFSTQQTNPANPVTGVSLQAQKKVYQLGDQPTLLLHFRHTGKQTSFLQRIAGPQDVYATGEPSVTVDYDGRVAANVSSSVASKGGDFLVTLQSQNQLQPGTYTVSASGETTSGQHYNKTTTFAWGVLAVNTTKSIYLPDETADLQMGVLDSQGHTVCAAPLRLTITDPSGNQQQVPYQPSVSCKGDSFANTPDYTATYKTGSVGQYKITLGIQSTGYAISSYFEVRASVPFDITRDAVTRIYPVHPYGMGIRVVANQDFVGTATETISDARFKILEAPDASVSKKDGKVLLSWHVNWKRGSQYDLSYQYLAPLVSPAFYTLGPLHLTTENGRTVFQEARAWQVAGDAAIQLVNQTEKNVPGTNPGCPCSTDTTTISPSTTAGDTLVLLVANSGNSGTQLNTVFDGANTWTMPSSSHTCTGSTSTVFLPECNVTGTSSDIAMAYVVNAAAISSITVTIVSPKPFAYTLLEFSNIDSVNPISKSQTTTNYQSTSQSNATSTDSHTTATATVNTCDSPTTSQLLRGGEYFCQSVNELIVGMVNAGPNNTDGLTPVYQLTSTGAPPDIGCGAQFTGYCALTNTMNMNNGVDQAAGAYAVTPTSGSYSINWSTNGGGSGCVVPDVCHGDGTGIMVFQQNGNTSGGDKQSFFWAK